MVKPRPMEETWPASKTELWPLERIVPYPQNPRLHSPEQVELLARSMIEDGVTAPILVDEEGVIIYGHGRRQAAEKNAFARYPVVVARGWSEQKKRAYRIKDNSYAMLSTWSEELLRVELNDLAAAGYEMPLLGFNDVQLVSFLSVPSGADPERVPEVPIKPTSKLGDLWQMGRHRLLCGDGTSTVDLERLMGDEQADLVFTDPPYRMAAEGGSAQPIGRAAARLGDSIKHLIDFDPPAFLTALPTVFKRGCLNAYVFCNKDLVPDYLNWAVAKGYTFNILFWKKPMAIPLGGQHRPDIEYLLFFRRQATWNNAVEAANYSKCLEYGRETDDLHPTMKPVALIANEVLISSKPGSIVVDFFSGSGSTMIACETSNRRCFSLELDPGYADVGIERWQTFSKGEAILVGDGRTFAEVARARLKKAAPAAQRGAAKRKKEKEAAE